MKKRNTISSLNKLDWAIFIVCSIGAVCMFYLYYKDLTSFRLKNNEQEVATIYFKKNTAQRKYIDNDIWERLNDESPVYNGDKIRTSKDSEVYAEFKDSGTKIQLKENSLIQIFKTKKEKSVNFISGEIFLSKVSEDDDTVIKIGVKEISSSQKADVKITIPKIEEVQEDLKEIQTEATIEVLSGEIEVTDTPSSKKASEKKQKKEKPAKKIKTGETLVVKIEEEFNLPKEEVKEVAKGDNSKEEVKEEKTEEEKSDEKASGKDDEKSETADAAEDSSSETALKEEVKEEEPVTEEVVIGDKGVSELPYVDIKYNFWQGFVSEDGSTYNYEYNFGTQEIFGENKSIPKGTVLEFDFSGVPDKDMPVYGFQFSTGGKDWIPANDFVWKMPNGEGFRAGVPFHDKFRVVLIRDIKNTNKSRCAISYMPDYGEQDIKIRNYKLTGRVVSLNEADTVTNVQPGYKNSIKIEKAKIIRKYWKKTESGFELYIPPSVLGYSKSVPQGTKIKVTFRGTMDVPMTWFDFHLINIKPQGQWDFISCDLADKRIKPGEPFELTQKFTTSKRYNNTDNGGIQISMGNTGKEEFLTLTDAEVEIEILP